MRVDQGDRPLAGIGQQLGLGGHPGGPQTVGAALPRPSRRFRRSWRTARWPTARGDLEGEAHRRVVNEPRRRTRRWRACHHLGGEDDGLPASLRGSSLTKESSAARRSMAPCGPAAVTAEGMENQRSFLDLVAVRTWSPRASGSARRSVRGPGGKYCQPPRIRFTR